MTQVVAALICDGDRIFICQRPAHKARGLLWEFPGGKVESGETRQQALVRECQEELNVTVSVGAIFYETDHTYPDLTIHLTLFLARLVQEEPQRLEHHAFRWITPQEMDAYPFCPADEEIVDWIKRHSEEVFRWD